MNQSRMFRYLLATSTWIGLFLACLSWAHADCLELKNDTFDQQAKPQVTAIRSFCISEHFGAIFEAPDNIIIQKIRLLISGDGKRVMENTVLKLSIFREQTTSNVSPGEQLVKEIEYSPPGSISQPTPQWLELEKIDTSFKKGDPDNPVILVPPQGKPGFKIAEKAQVTLRHLRIEGGLRGIVVETQARLTLQHIQLNNAVGQAIAALQAHVILDNVTVQDIKTPTDEQFKQIGQAQGIRAEGGNLTVTNCKFLNTANRGINILKHGIATIQSSTFTGMGEQSVAAIAFQEAQGIIQNVTLQQWKEGLFLSTSSVSMEHSTLTNLTGNAILVSDQSWIQLRNNTISQAKQSGISLSNSSENLTLNTIESTEEYGIFLFQRVANNQTVITQNTIRNCLGAGIQVFNSLALIADNRISGTRKRSKEDDGHGIASLDTTDVQILKNEIQDSQGTGIFLLRSTGRLAQNRIENNRESGIFVSDTPKGYHVGMTENQVNKNHIAGILVNKSKVLFLENTVAFTVYEASEQSGSGVVIYGQSDAEIVKDNYHSNEQHGLLIAANSKANVSETTLQDNKSWGIFLDCTNSQLIEQKNQYARNAQGDKNKCP